MGLTAWGKHSTSQLLIIDNKYISRANTLGSGRIINQLAVAINQKKKTNRTRFKLNQSNCTILDGSRTKGQTHWVVIHPGDWIEVAHAVKLLNVRAWLGQTEEGQVRMADHRLPQEGLHSFSHCKLHISSLFQPQPQGREGDACWEIQSSVTLTSC